MPFGVLDFPEIAAVYARFAALTGLSRSLGGELFLYPGLDRDGMAVAVASNVAGAASLGIEPNADRAKDALRAGVCDFVVNTLDEALRILKNEIRKKRGVSVVVTGDVTATVAEIVERGVQPEILAWPVQELMDRGARVLDVDAENEMARAPVSVSVSVSWIVESEPLKWLPLVDALAVHALRDKNERVRWIEAAPRYLGRAFAGQRFVEMGDAETDAFVEAVRREVNAGAIPVAVSLVIAGRETAIS
jgi:hypothetical protein